MKRFVKEYANYRYKEFYRISPDNKALNKITRIIKLYERNYISANEAIKILSGIKSEV